MMFADLDPLIAIAFAIGWAIISALFKKKKDAEDWAEWDERPAAPPVILPPAPRSSPVIPTTATATHPAIQDEEGPQVELTHVWQHAGQAMAQAHREQERARERLRQLEQKLAPTPPAAAHHSPRHQLAAKLRRRENLRETILATVILGPPKALEP